MSALRIEDTDAKYYKWEQYPGDIIHYYKDTGEMALHVNPALLKMNIIHTKQIPRIAERITESEYMAMQQHVYSEIQKFL